MISSLFPDVGERSGILRTNPASLVTVAIRGPFSECEGRLAIYFNANRSYDGPPPPAPAGGRARGEVRKVYRLRTGGRSETEPAKGR